MELLGIKKYAISFKVKQLRQFWIIDIRKKLVVLYLLKVKIVDHKTTYIKGGFIFLNSHPRDSNIKTTYLPWNKYKNILHAKIKYIMVMLVKKKLNLTCTCLNNYIYGCNLQELKQFNITYKKNNRKLNFDET